MEEIKKLTKIMTGIYTVNADSEWYREDCDCFILVINKEYYLAYVDPDDGYRSYSVLACIGNTLSKHIKISTSIPVGQDVYIEDYTEYDIDDYEEITGTRIANANTHQTILEIYTNNIDAYYPVGVVRYYPENLDANLNK